MMKKGDYKNDMGNKAARREKVMGGGMMRKEMGHGGRMKYNKGGLSQPMYAHGECPKASAN
jgi:hypothetical protein